MTEGRQITDPAAIARFMTGGKATFTLVSKATRQRYTYHMRQASHKSNYFVSVMYGSDNVRDFTYMGFVADGKFAATQKSKVSEIDIRFASFAWFHKAVLSGSAKLDQVEFWHEGKCACCGRKLTVPASIESGVGPECAKRM